MEDKGEVNATSLKECVAQETGKTQRYNVNALRNVLDRLYECRDLEISNLWQRSVFLSVFMILCYTGYGCLVTQIVENIDNTLKITYLHTVAVALGCISAIFSVLWIAMAKASKAWYEVYETAISSFETLQ